MKRDQKRRTEIVAKIVPSTPDTYPPLESAKLAAEFALLARQDARAAKLLYKNRLYGLSAFHAQQAVEKATKSVALLIGLIDPTSEHLVKAVGHDTLLGVTTSLPEFVEATVKQWDELTAKAKGNADFDKGVTVMDAILTAVKDAYIHQTKDPAEILKREEEMKKAITMRERFAQTGEGIEKARDVDKIRSQLLPLPGLIKKHRGYLWRSTMGLETNPGLEATISALRTRADQAEKELQAIKAFRSPKIVKWLSDPDFIFYFSYIRGIAFHMSMNLAVITMLHERPPRYPPVGAKDYWTSDAYAADSRFVKLLPELLKWTEIYCEATFEGSKAVLAHYSNRI